MLSYCLNCKKIQKVKNQGLQLEKRKNNSFINCGHCSSKKLRFIKEQEAKVLLSMIGKFPLLGLLLI